VRQLKKDLSRTELEKLALIEAILSIKTANIFTSSPRMIKNSRTGRIQNSVNHTYVSYVDTILSINFTCQSSINHYYLMTQS